MKLYHAPKRTLYEIFNKKKTRISFVYIDNHVYYTLVNVTRKQKMSVNERRKYKH